MAEDNVAEISEKSGPKSIYTFFLDKFLSRTAVGTGLSINTFWLVYFMPLKSDGVSKIKKAVGQNMFPFPGQHIDIDGAINNFFQSAPKPSENLDVFLQPGMPCLLAKSVKIPQDTISIEHSKYGVTGGSGAMTMPSVNGVREANDNLSIEFYVNDYGVETFLFRPWAKAISLYGTKYADLKTQVRIRKYTRRYNEWVCHTDYIFNNTFPLGSRDENLTYTGDDMTKTVTVDWAYDYYSCLNKKPKGSLPEELKVDYINVKTKDLDKSVGANIFGYGVHSSLSYYLPSIYKVSSKVKEKLFGIGGKVDTSAIMGHTSDDSPSVDGGAAMLGGAVTGSAKADGKLAILGDVDKNDEPCMKDISIKEVKVDENDVPNPIILAKQEMVNLQIDQDDHYDKELTAPVELGTVPYNDFAFAGDTVDKIMLKTPFDDTPTPTERMDVDKIMVKTPDNDTRKDGNKLEYISNVIPDNDSVGDSLEVEMIKKSVKQNDFRNDGAKTDLAINVTLPENDSRKDGDGITYISKNVSDDDSRKDNEPVTYITKSVNEDDVRNESGGGVNYIKKELLKGGSPENGSISYYRNSTASGGNSKITVETPKNNFNSQSARLNVRLGETSVNGDNTQSTVLNAIKRNTDVSVVSKGAIEKSAVIKDIKPVNNVDITKLIKPVVVETVNASGKSAKIVETVNKGGIKIHDDKIAIIK